MNRSDTTRNPHADFPSIFDITQRLAAIEALLRELLPNRSLECQTGPDDEHVLAETCPLRCLAPPVLSARAYGAIQGNLELLVVGDVLRRARSGELADLRKVGGTHAAEIESVLLDSGLLAPGRDSDEII